MPVVTQPPLPGPGRSPSPVWGWVLVVPALLLWLSGLVPPVLSTLYLSLMRVEAIGGGGRFAGLENYALLFKDDAYVRAAGFTLLLVVVRVVAVAVVPPLLAWGTVALGRKAAAPLGVVFAVPLVFATPAFAALAFRVQAEPGALATPTGARVAVLGFDGTYALLYACGLGLGVLVAAFRAGSGRRPFLVAWAVGLIAAAASGLQAFTEVSVMTAGGPARATVTLGYQSLVDGFQRMELGYAATQGVILLVPVLVLGLCAGVLVILTRAALDLRPDSAGRGPVRKAAAVAVGGVALLLALVVWVRGLAPIVAGWSGHEVRGVSAGGTVLRVLVHDVPTTLLVVVVALAGALGIVVFRPLGRRSEWLLLPFAPWLFVTTVAQAPALFLAYTHGVTQRPFAHLQPALGLLPILLFAFTVILRGLEPRWRAARARREPVAFARHIMAPAWLAVLGVSAGAFAAVTHEYVTAWLTIPEAGEQPLPVALVRASQSYLVRAPAAVTRPDIPLALIALAVIAPAIAWYAGRAVLRTPGPPGDQTEATGG